jgi:hypothetical protein
LGSSALWALLTSLLSWLYRLSTAFLDRHSTFPASPASLCLHCGLGSTLMASHITVSVAAYRHSNPATHCLTFLWNMDGSIHDSVTLALLACKTSIMWVTLKCAASSSGSGGPLHIDCIGLWVPRWLITVKQILGKQLSRWLCVSRVPQVLSFQGRVFQMSLPFLPLSLPRVGSSKFLLSPIQSSWILLSGPDLFSTHTFFSFWPKIHLCFFSRQTASF